MCARKSLLELGRADRALRQHIIELLGGSGDVRIGTWRLVINGLDVGVLVEPVCDGLVEQFFLALLVIVEPALVVTLFISWSAVRCSYSSSSRSRTI